MSDALLPWYDREIEYLRQSGAEFAARHPKVASRLSLDEQGTRDPHVERIVQAFAYMNARIRHMLDDDFPEITDALLGVLYPHYLNPVPSMSIVDFGLDRSQRELTAGYSIPRDTPVESERVNDERCQFRTCYPVKLWPWEITDCRLQSRPFAVPNTRLSSTAEAVLKIQLTTFDPAVSISKFDVDSLRLYLNAPQFQTAADLYELLCNDVIEVVLAADADDPHPITLSADNIRPVGFDRDEAVLPATSRTHPGYRLLSEYFAFPQKFLFVELSGIKREMLKNIGSTLEVCFLLKRSHPELERLVTTDSVRLGATPIINLFEQSADAIPLRERQTEYRIIADARREDSLEIYSVNDVSASDTEGDVRTYHPFYGVHHAGEDGKAYYHVIRRPGPIASDVLSPDGGSQVYLTLVDSAFMPTEPADRTLHVETTCFNRDLPQKLAFGRGRPAFDLPGGRGPVSRISCLTAPTPTRRPQYRKHNLWRLISHLSLNHLSLESGENSSRPLQEMLTLYDFVDSAETRNMIAGISNVSSKRSVNRVGGRMGGFCRGVDLELTFDAEKYTGSSVYLFASVIERFLGLFVSVNSYTRTIGMTQQMKERGERWVWSPRAGERILI